MENFEIKKLATKLVNYDAEKLALNSFLHFFTDNDGEIKYLTQVAQKKVIIDWNDLNIHDSGLVERMKKNTQSYLNIIYGIIDTINTPTDVVMAHRLERIKEKYPESNAAEIIPSALMRDYTVSFTPQMNLTVPIRAIKSSKIGEFLTTRGIITKISQVKPKLTVAVYVCDSCGSETYQQIKSKEFSILTVCESKKCKIMKIRGTLNLITRVSKFVPHVALTIQEMQCDVPEGCIPRIIAVEMDHNILRRESDHFNEEIALPDGANFNEENNSDGFNIKPGDSIYLCGILMARQKNGLMNEMFIEGYGVSPYVEEEKKNTHFSNTLEEKDGILSALEEFNSQNVSEQKNIELSSSGKDFSKENVLKSYAPQIYGLPHVKKILLLSLLGAPTIQKSDGMKIRGHINVLLVGDPGIAKSELLKYTLSLSQRGVYTAGRGSSGVGLTASVLRDNLTKEYVLEAGALVLSDKGVCCLDEMDKMDDKDRLSLHEVLEQQTVSINKAGINVSLAARCTVLGAANFHTKYNKKKTLEWNTGLPTSLLSRFDSVLLLKDEKDSVRDKALSDYVLNLHLNEERSSEAGNLTTEDLKNFVIRAKKINPVLTNSVNLKIKEAYVEARQTFERLTPRYLLSLIRFSLAHARLRMSPVVELEDVEESIKLLSMSSENKKKKNTLAPKYLVYNEIIKLAKNNENRVAISDLMSHLAEFSEELITNTIREFEENGIWMVQNDTLTVFQP